MVKVNIEVVPEETLGKHVRYEENWELRIMRCNAHISDMISTTRTASTMATCCIYQKPYDDGELEDIMFNSKRDLTSLTTNG